MANRLFPLRDAAQAVSRRAQAEPTPRSVCATPADLATPTGPVATTVLLALLSFFTDTELVEVRNLLVSAGELSNETADLLDRARRVNERIAEIVAAVRARNPQIN